ncbi:MAG: Response regulator receiver modulated diguanylate cyclase with PAS/PAC sensor [Candidatus Daviesbacteria bacterium GW2011_GWA1_41_61]|uniref:histidine kinase n=1 Tax=Candidatus Daviesbacteria bacterium GW2011_GWA2_40_9 TaxID=1618424 RepID=A0A0G0TZT9_9BACT|nr:MAG: hypothetical protein UU26_C0030G0005 [Candidatus Daviesbacteria bacterium GW2011_GWC1_40_9]KKR82419.1 MAG: Response regulator receiver modulated diguanylate cyclase with PAS/PAC sensor [Candidatus Daviesbacteria bacterium GW2011_GWA2_40_9]KKR92385.1 MAG: Response regulator receiver modulated diguanylate cyclase with PAS/PAC sensor [Candidatus Daviesbacteria bacterium GW2011_GWB1_41_15]KKS14573.1 MAG: Response regulator receiver modulated diguanylate cyclase with PAS/PAC sensor [Candidatu
MDPLALVLILGGNLILLGVFLWYFKKSQAAILKRNEEAEKGERELKRRVLELQLLRSLGERAGYSLDFRKILEVVTDSLEGIVPFSTVSYLLLGVEGRVISRIHVEEAVCRSFLDQVRLQMLQAFSTMLGRELQESLVDETLSGTALDDRLNLAVGSFFNLPIVVGGQIIGLVNVSSPLKGLYADEETAILYTILNQVSSQATKLYQVVENEKRKLSAMVSSLSDGVVMVDPRLHILVCNLAARAMFNLEGEFHLWEIFPALGKETDLKGALKQALEQQNLVKLSEVEINGKAIQIDVEPVKDRFGYLLGAVIVFHDITAQKQLETLRESFTAMMVHELRTPLTTIFYSTNMILSDFEKLPLKDLQGNIEIIKSSATNMLGLVNDLLDVARIDAGRFEVVKKEDSLQNLLEEKAAVFKSLVDGKNLKLTVEIDQDLPQTFPFDRRRLGQTLDNLLSNAIKYTDAGQVNLKVKVKDAAALVSVSDSGDGIKRDDLPKLFSKFEQLGKGKTGERRGTGLGLVIAKGIIEAHGGKIWAASAGLGKGATFSFTLPLNF